MSGQTITSTDAAFFALPTASRKKRQPFLEALEQVEYGRLTLTLPGGEKQVFQGAGDGPEADWQLYDWQVFDDFVARGELGLADAYIDGRWDSHNIEALITFGLLNADRLEKFFHGRPLYALWLRFSALFKGNSVKGSRRNVSAHYDLGNDFYRLWLDDSMTYSCALFEGNTSRTLEEAQQKKYARILGKLGAAPGDHILEIGCGWGGFAEAAARRGIKVTAITLAHTQADYAKERIKKAGLDHLVTIELIDYRQVKGTFDHIVSIGMFEHVGQKYWPTYFSTLQQRLKPGGKALVQTITLDDALFEKLGNVTGFIEHYIFPGGMLPSKSRFRSQAGAAGLECRELYAFGGDYAITLKHWLMRFEARLEEVRALGYDEYFIRLWRFYLASCIATFKSQRSDVMQAELMLDAAAQSVPDYGYVLTQAA